MVHDQKNDEKEATKKDTESNNCEYTTSCKGDLETHVKFMHDNNKCKRCDYSTSQNKQKRVAEGFAISEHIEKGYLKST